LGPRSRVERPGQGARSQAVAKALETASIPLPAGDRAYPCSRATCTEEGRLGGYYEGSKKVFTHCGYYGSTKRAKTNARPGRAGYRSSQHPGQQ
jgi:hypothetical protein